MRHVKLIASVLAAMSLSFVLADTTSFAAESAASRDKKEGRLMESTTTMPELTREYLLANGFKPLAASPDSFIAEKVRLGDVASILGFKITSLRPTVSQPDHSDVRTGSVQSRRFVVRSEVRDTQGKIVRGSLNEANSLCTVTISLKKVATAKPPLPTDSSPGVRVKSVTVPKRRTEPLQIVFELSADGKSPLAVTEAQVSVRLYDGETCVFEGHPTKNPPDVFRVQSGKPSTFSIALKAKVRNNGAWGDLVPGKYVLRVVVVGAGSMKSQGPPVDYQRRGGVPAPDERSSEGYKIAIDRSEGNISGEVD